MLTTAFYCLLYPADQMRKQFLSLLQDAGFASNEPAELRELNSNAENMNVVRAVLVAGLYPNVASVRHAGSINSHLFIIAFEGETAFIVSLLLPSRQTSRETSAFAANA